MSPMPASYLWLIPLLPFAGFLINGTLGRRLPRAAVSAVALLFTAVPAGLVAWLWVTMRAAGDAYDVQQHRPMDSKSPASSVDFAFTVDHLTLIMLGVVTGVGFIIHIYSVGYMAEEEGYWRFFAYLNLFMFFMSVLVLAESFLLLFVGWEGVGLASYLLIGFYFQKTSAANAGKKAFLRQPHRRLRVSAGDVSAGRAFRLTELHPDLCDDRTASGVAGRSVSLLPSRCCWCWARRASPRRFRCMCGCRTRWRARRRFQR